jgi:hypothetical protein
LRDSATEIRRAADRHELGAQGEKEGLQAFVWAMAPSALAGRRAADGLEVSHGGTEAQRRSGAAAVENKLGEEPRGSELPVALSGLGIRQA